MANLFNSVKGLKPKRNSFSSFSYRNDYTCNLGQVVPVYVQHTVPGTTIRVGTSALCRLQALISPIMDNIDYYVHFWQVPYRLIENGMFTKFVGGEIDPEDYDPAYIVGHDVKSALSLFSGLTSSDIDKIIGNGSLCDMLGWDKNYFNQTTLSIKTNIRPLQAYFFMLLNWYVNEHIMPFPDFKTDVEDVLNAEGNASGKVATLLAHLYLSHGLFFNHGWQKDYFTSALPNVQEGSPVTLPIAGSATGTMSGVPLDITVSGDGLGFISNENADNDSLIFTGNANDVGVIETQTAGGQIIGLNGVANSEEGAIDVDLSEATAITINELRVANALQVFKERIMRFGHRAQEYYKGFFNVTPEDLRLQLPKYLGGGRIPVNIADIEQTSETADTPQGNLAGKATALAGGFAGFTTYTSEESIILGVAWFMPKVTYSNGISRFLLKLNDRYDYFNPSFEHLGEQEIQNIEIFSGGNSNDFGYTPRFAEYRFHQNEQHGEFKGSLAHWTLGRIFDQTPALNADFIYMQPNVLNRIFAVKTDSSGRPVPNCLCSLKFSVRVIQPVSRYGTPMLLA